MHVRTMLRTTSLAAVACAAGCAPNLFPWFGGESLTEGRRLSVPRPLTTITRPTTQRLIDGGSLAGGSSDAAGACIVEWDPTRAQQDIVLDGVRASVTGSTFNGVRSTGAHDSGRHYFEIVFDALGDGSFNSVAVVADDPVLAPDESYFDEVGCGIGIGHCTSVRGFAAGDVVSIMADLDTGRVDFAINGALTSADNLGFDPRALAIVPGAGPFRAGITLAENASARANFGAEPFAFSPPQGFEPWGSGLPADDDGRCISAPALLLTPAPVSAGVDCDAGYHLSTVDTGVDVGDGPALALFGVYESSATGDVEVSIDRPGRYVVVLGSYESVDWTVRQGDGVTIERVIARSYEGASVSAPAGTIVDASSFVTDEMSDYVSGHAWPYSFGGSDTVGFVGHAEALTGLRLSTFAGAYDNDRFVLHADSATTGECR